ncbi:Os03g0687600 [Oryza sativa Japonica Group]|uniref:Os03g0687600 protein n=1 Tax=Oryza sativa subsp. japonica TaxID=39947 RepID=A0A0P0W1M0_ORYSJ|nr:hypothetical protein DAI22_03g295700 [Oryza sativa Japonica Group]BAS85818.1 Os03g0687600 [Oryza sativa Japonica Group]
MGSLTSPRTRTIHARPAPLRGRTWRQAGRAHRRRCGASHGLPSHPAGGSKPCCTLRPQLVEAALLRQVMLLLLVLFGLSWSQGSRRPVAAAVPMPAMVIWPTSSSYFSAAT